MNTLKKEWFKIEPFFLPFREVNNDGDGDNFYSSDFVLKDHVGLLATLSPSCLATTYQ